MGVLPAGLGFAFDPLGILTETSSLLLCGLSFSTWEMGTSWHHHSWEVLRSPSLVLPVGTSSAGDGAESQSLGGWSQR